MRYLSPNTEEKRLSIVAETIKRGAIATGSHQAFANRGRVTKKSVPSYDEHENDHRHVGQSLRSDSLSTIHPSMYDGDLTREVSTDGLIENRPLSPSLSPAPRDPILATAKAVRVDSVGIDELGEKVLRNVRHSQFPGPE